MTTRDLWLALLMVSASGVVTTTLIALTGAVVYLLV